MWCLLFVVVVVVVRVGGVVVGLDFRRTSFHRTPFCRTAQNFALFFFSPAPMFALFLSLGRSSRGCLDAGAVKCLRLEFSGCHVKPRRPPKPSGFHSTTGRQGGHLLSCICPFLQTTPSLPGLVKTPKPWGCPMCATVPHVSVVVRHPTKSWSGWNAHHQEERVVHPWDLLNNTFHQRERGSTPPPPTLPFYPFNPHSPLPSQKKSTLTPPSPLSTPPPLPP